MLPVGDFALYDHVLDAAAMAGVVAPRHRGADRFAACRGADGVRPLEMTKWFDTNYHYLVPELADDAPFGLDAGELARRTSREARELGLEPRPVRARAAVAAAADQGRRRIRLRAAAGADRRIRGVTRAPRGRGRDGGPARRAVLGARPRRRGAATRSPRAYERAVRRTRRACAWPRTSAALDDAALARVRRAAGSPSCTSTSCARRSELDAVLAGAARRAPPVARAWSTAATSGRPTSTSRSTGSTAWSRQSARDRLTIAPSCSLLHVPYNAARETHARPRAARRGSRSPMRSSPSSTLLAARWSRPTAATRDELLAPARAPRRGPPRPRRARTSRGARARRRARRRATTTRDTPLDERRAAQAARARAAGAPDHDDRVVPADARDPRRRAGARGRG